MKKFSILLILIFIGLGIAFPNGMFYSHSKSGDLVTEPFALNNCKILSEKLFVDLRKLENNGAATVIAEYKLLIEKPADSLLFLFVAASKISDGVLIELDGKPLKIAIDSSGYLSAQIKKTTVVTPWGEPEGYSDKSEYFKEEYVFCKMSFIEEGHHTLRIKYKTRTTETYLYKNESKTTIQTFSYAFYPARNWKSFGGLDLEIRYPGEWEIKSNIPLNASEGSVAKSFSEIPADFLHVHVRYPETKANFYLTLYDVLTIGILTIVSLLMAGRIVKHKSVLRRFVLLFLLSLATTIIFMTAYIRKGEFFKVFITDEIVFPGDRAYIVLASPVLLIIVFLILIILSFIMRKIQLAMHKGH
ncbi:hypothetical protein QQ020_12955 [Fulvivirgaceae bacterium BMA12]|uniref:Uncharacterized protein n=1 Tax=Agaribacillus aureus TaxID=3051825 RepID=A0ABT8L5G8_9BACT|nr:hypothetical protein [Fulvivirgaceae bacterium BMA12]